LQRLAFPSFFIWGNANPFSSLSNGFGVSNQNYHNENKSSSYEKELKSSLKSIKEENFWEKIAPLLF